MTQFQNTMFLMAWLKKLGCKNVVLCPGSRNAALIQAFEQANFNCISHFDERSAAYFALGNARGMDEWVAVCCTSGTAALNFVPAAAEAAAQKQKVIFITADRPKGEKLSYANQSISQINAFKDYVSQSLDLDAKNDEFLSVLPKEVVSEIPLHINVRYHEPFYEFSHEQLDVNESSLELKIGDERVNKEGVIYKPLHAFKYMLVAGYDSDILNKAKGLEKQIPIFGDTFSPDYAYGNIGNLELYLNELTKEDFPDVLITSGTYLLSKKIRIWLKSGMLKQHWHIDDNKHYTSPFQSQEFNRISKLNFDQLVDVIYPEKNYLRSFKDLEDKASKRLEKYAKGNQLFNVIDRVVAQYNLDSFHCGNSMSARYGAIYASVNGNIKKLFANRGTAGIDGCISTFLGYCAAHKEKHHLLIIGDVSFKYDFNAFGVEPSLNNFTVLILNNSGGFIFDIVKGTEKLSEGALQKMRTKRKNNFQSLANSASIPYQRMKSDTEKPITFGLIEISLDSKLEKDKYVQLFKD